ncbi:MAG TPA: helix-turn-helix domain-containing protein [Solirubrobacteraceae bacterium]|nr:helix-turn-helix domain-containing protein [Solirubrobacteraceae bacterium]
MREMVADGGTIDGAILEVRPEAVQNLVERVSAQVESIAGQMVERYRAQITDYRLVDDEILREDVYGVSLAAMRVTVANLASGRRPSIGELESTRAGAARRVHQNVSLESFLHALRLWGQTLWETILVSVDGNVPAERDAALQIAGQLLEHLDLQSMAAAQGFLEELQSVWSDREVVRRDLLDALIAGDGDSERVRRLARSLQLRLHDNYIVVIVRGGERATEEAPDQPLTTRVALRRMVEAARTRLRPTAGSLLVGMRHGEVVALYPFAEPTELEQVRAGCQTLASDLEEHGTSVGMSGCHVGLSQLSAGYSEAREAVEIAVGTGTRGRVIAFEDVLIDSIIRSSRHAEQVVHSTIAPLLAYDAGRQAEFVSTLRAYVDAGFNVAKSAEVLCVHPNTVVYRLGRIKALTGRDPHVADDLLLLQLGLKLIDLRSQPE